MELVESKICAMISLGLSSMLVGLLPAWFSNHGRNNWPLFLSCLLCIGAGVLLSTSVVHMLPEIKEMLVGYENFTEILFCCGFFLLYLTDELVHFLKGNAHDAHHLNRNETQPIHGMRRHSFTHRNSQNYGTVEYSERQLAYNPNFSKAWSENDLSYDNPPSQLCHVAHQEPCNITPVGTIGLLIALSVHGILEGLAVGVEKSTSKVTINKLNFSLFNFIVLGFINVGSNCNT